MRVGYAFLRGIVLRAYLLRPYECLASVDGARKASLRALRLVLRKRAQQPLGCLVPACSRCEGV